MGQSPRDITQGNMAESFRREEESGEVNEISCITGFLQNLEGLSYDALSVTQIAAAMGVQSDDKKVVDTTFSLCTVLEVAFILADVGTGFAKIDMTALTLSRILHLVENIDKKTEIIIQTPIRKAQKKMKTIINLIKTNKFELAYDDVNKLRDYASDAFEISSQKDKTMANFKDSVLSTK